MYHEHYFGVKPIYILRPNIVDKFKKLSYINFSMECFTYNFLQFFRTSIKIYLFDGPLGTHHQFQAFPIASLGDS